ncbi:sugar-binding protein [Persicobacter diffluens]|uniref:Carbohydrate-binding domain-containing protein n=1 Tax=Persicobacter diffluens TaxID=981 RepID=A0AAN4W3X4_9BACT|nr:hypothetical protein PEDI_49810 [Persicobacter diffluens]
MKNVKLKSFLLLVVMLISQMYHVTLANTTDEPTLTWSYFHNPFNGTDLNGTTHTVTTHGAVTASQADGELVIELNGRESYQNIVTIEFANTIDVSNAAEVFSTFQSTVFTRADGQAVDGRNVVVWQLVDVDGNGTKTDAWEAEININDDAIAGQDYLHNSYANGNVKQGCDLTKVKSINLINRSYPGDWSVINSFGTITISDLKVGKIIEATSFVGESYYENAFSEPGRLSDVNQTTVAGADVNLVQDNGYLMASFTDLAADAELFSTMLEEPINLDLALTPDFVFDLRPSLNAEATIKAMVYDADGVAATSQEIVLHDMDSTIEFQVVAGDADLSNITKIAFVNGGQPISGSFSIDNLRVGNRDTKLVLDAREMEVEARPEAVITVDGIADEAVWAEITATELDRLVYWNDDYKDAPTPENISATYKVFYSATDLHVFIDVTDDSNSSLPDGASDGYKYDGIEMYFNTDLTNDPEDGSYTTDVHQLGINRENGDHAGEKISNNGLTANYAFKEKTDGTGYTAEYSIPFSELNVPVEVGTSFGFELSVTDADIDINNNERTRKVVWNMDRNHDVAWQNTKAFGTLILAEAPKEEVAVSAQALNDKVVEVTLSPAVLDLTTDHFVLTQKGNASPITLKSATTADDGVTYLVESRIAFDPAQTYMIALNRLGFDFGDAVEFTYEDVVASSGDQLEGLRYYPSPVTDVLNVECKDLQKVCIYTLDGRMLEQVEALSDDVRIVTAGFPSGILIVKIIAEGGESVVKIVK